MKKMISIVCIAASASMAGLIELTPNTADTKVTSSGTVFWVGGTENRVGTDAGIGTIVGYVMPFLMTSLPAGESITGVTLRFNVSTLSNVTTSHGDEPNVDLLGVRISASPTVVASDLTGTVIANNIYAPINQAALGTKTATVLTDWLAANWTPGSYVFLTLTPDAGNPKNSEWIGISAKESGANAPLLSVTTSTIPEPATIGMLGLGALLAVGIRRLRG